MIFELIKNGPGSVFSNPLWLVLLLSGIVMNYLNMRISVDQESDAKNPKKSLWLSIIVALSIAALISILLRQINSFAVADALIFGAIVFIFGLIPSIYVYKLRIEKQKNWEE